MPWPGAMVGAAKPDWVLLVASLLSPPAPPVAPGPAVLDAGEAEDLLSPESSPESAGALLAGVVPHRS